MDTSNAIKRERATARGQSTPLKRERSPIRREGTPVTHSDIIFNSENKRPKHETNYIKSERTILGLENIRARHEGTPAPAAHHAQPAIPRAATTPSPIRHINGIPVRTDRGDTPPSKRRPDSRRNYYASLPPRPANAKPQRIIRIVVKHGQKRRKLTNAYATPNTKRLFLRCGAKRVELKQDPYDFVVLGPGPEWEGCPSDAEVTEDSDGETIIVFPTKDIKGEKGQETYMRKEKAEVKVEKRRFEEEDDDEVVLVSERPVKKQRVR